MMTTPQGTSQRALADPAVYLALSTASGFVELGALFLAVRSGFSTVVLLVVGLAYQIGALFTNPFALNGAQYRALVVVAALVGIVVSRVPLVLPVALLFLGVGLQGLREEVQERARVGTLAKRASRVLGFVVAGFFDARAMVVVSLVALALVSVRRVPLEPSPARPRLARDRSIGVAGVAMVIHQMHYFAYAYVLPVFLLRGHKLSGIAAGLAFALGWVSYSLAPALLGKLPTLQVVVVGHLAVAAALVAMAVYCDRLPLLLAAWFASGFGGGTVFGIRLLARSWASVDRTSDLDMWENVGHVLGVIAAALLMVIESRERLLFLMGAGLAFLVAGLVWVTGRARH